MLEPPEGMQVGRFGPYEVNLTTGELRKHGIRLKLQDQPFQILVLLLARPGKLVTREEIRQRLWPSGTFVDFDNGLNTALSRLREALGDSAESPRYIETLARRGYRWIVPVDWMASRTPDLPTAVSLEAPFEAEATSDHLIGKKISHYRVLGVLGGGGMGLVYRAEDIKLGRGVALKFLPEEMAHDPVALDRFEREARAASALNHPHICTIYEFEEYEGQPFIVMELLDGQTLRERLGNAREQLQKNELIDLAIQITDGLDAAHQKDIIHRDIKTANIFLTNRGEAKILDFGLAKIEHPLNPLGEEVDETFPPRESTSKLSLNSTLTHAGALIGTVSYMSPEQVRGEKLDARTDLFSFGLVLYEMATGQRAFQGNTVMQVNEAILHRTPAPARDWNAELPPDLELIIDKTLQKDREMRYQSASEIRSDLKRLKGESEIGGAVASATDSNTHAVAASGTPVKPTASVGPVSSGSSLITTAIQHKWGFGFAVIVGISLIIAAARGTYVNLTRNHPFPFQNISVTKLDGTEGTWNVAISPDGQYILNVVRKSGLDSLWLRNIPTNSNTRVMPPTKDGYLALRFSPDGNYLYFVKGEGISGARGYLYRVPVLGGSPEKLLSGIVSNVSFSPDGQEFAYISAEDPQPGYWRLMVRNVQSGRARALQSGSRDEPFEGPAWSPDGRVITGVTSAPTSGVDSLTSVDVRSGAKFAFFSPTLGSLVSPIWLPTGKGLLVLSQKNREHPQITFVSYPQGRSYPVTRDANSYVELSLSADGRTLAAILAVKRSNLVLVSAGNMDGKELRQLSTDTTVHDFDWANNGQMMIANSTGLNLLDPESGQQTLVSKKEALFLSTCGNGRTLAFSSVGESDGTVSVWRINLNGEGLNRLTKGRFDSLVGCSHRSPWMIYWDSSAEKLKRISIEDGTLEREYQQIPTPGGVAISPDDKLVAFADDDPDHHNIKLALLDPGSGETLRLMEFQRPISYESRLQFTQDGKAVVYATAANDAENLWLQPLDGSPGKQLTNFPVEGIKNFRWSLDGNKLVVLRGHIESDVVLIRDTDAP